jgi:hypothetical protein
MKVYLLIILSVCNIILTQTQQVCNLVTPTKQEDCTSKSIDKKEYCCYLYADNLSQNSKLCYSIPFQSYSGGKTYSLNGNTYFINCGVKIESSPLDTCSPDAHTSQKDCATGSSFTNSCCFEAATQQCYWLGTKYSGTTTWAEKQLECGADYMRISLLMIIALVTLLI